MDHGDGSNFAILVIIDHFKIYSFEGENYWSLTAMAERKLTQIKTKLSVSFITKCCWKFTLDGALKCKLILDTISRIFSVMKMFDI